jgi:hypothetical protein
MQKKIFSAYRLISVRIFANELLMGEEMRPLVTLESSSRCRAAKKSCGSSFVIRTH